MSGSSACSGSSASGSRLDRRGPGSRRTFDFTLLLSDIGDRLEEIENALYGGTCDDGLLGVDSGTLYVDSSRSADSFPEAVLSAVVDVESSLPEISVVAIEPGELVPAAEVARRAGRSRESVRLLHSGERGPGGFPRPAAGLRTRSRLWRWSEVAAWLAHHDLLDPEIAAQAEFIASVNAALELRRLRSTVEANPILLALANAA